MKYALNFLPQIEDDLLSGYRWYESRSKGLGEEFLRLSFTCAQKLTVNPERYRKIYINIRRCLLPRFPYTLYFILSDDTVTVIGLFHLARDPGRINQSLDERSR